MTMTTPKTRLVRYNVLAEIVDGSAGAGESGRWRFALRHATHVVTGADDPRHDGVWPGVMSVSGFRHELGANDERIVGPTVRVELRRGDGPHDLNDNRVEQIRREGYWAGFSVNLYAVSESRQAPSAAALIHVGRVGRGDVEIDAERVVVQCRDRADGDDRRIPDRFFADRAPVEESRWGRPVPVLIGDWAAERSDYWIRVTCVDTASGPVDAPLRARLCRPGMHGVASFGARAIWLDADGHYKRDETGYRDFAVRVVDAGTGVFELAGSEFSRVERRFEDGDAIYVDRPQGEAGISGAVIRNPARVIRHLLTDTVNGLGLGAAAIDEDSFEACAELADRYGYRCRGLIEDETTAPAVAASIGAEFGFRLTLRLGRYTLVPIGYFDGATATRALGDGQLIEWREWNDRDGIGSDGLMLRYRRRPDDGRPTRTYAWRSGSGAGMSRMESAWIYDDATAEARSSQWALAWSGTVRTLRARFGFEAVGVLPGDVVSLSGRLGEGAHLVTAVHYDFDPPVAVELDLCATHIPGRTGVWSAPPGAPVPDSLGGGAMPADFDAASAAQRRELSFWAGDTDNDPDGDPAKAWGL